MTVVVIDLLDIMYASRHFAGTVSPGNGSDFVLLFLDQLLHNGTATASSDTNNCDILGIILEC